jgi:hypothetical protein
VRLEDAVAVKVGVSDAVAVYVGSEQVWSAFSPLDIPWVDAYWAEGPQFLALGLAEGDGVTTWPSETAGGVDLVNVATAPVNRLAGLGGRPSVEAVGTSNLVRGGTTLAQPWTVVAVYVRNGGNTSPAITGAQANGSSNAGIQRTQFSAGVGMSFTGPSGAALVAATANGSSSEVWMNGTLTATGNAGTSTNARRQMFSRQSTGIISPLTGHIAFVGYIDRELTAEEHEDLGAWAIAHYGISPV